MNDAKCVGNELLERPVSNGFVNQALSGFNVRRRKHAEILSHVKLHAINLCQKTTDRGAVIYGICLSLPELRHLILKPGDSVHGCLQLLIITDHGVPFTISTIPR